MKKVQSIEGLMIMELTQRDNAYDPNLTQYIVVDRDRNEVGTGPAGLEESVVFAKGYYSDYLATFSVHGSMNIRASNENDAREKARRSSAGCGNHCRVATHTMCMKYPNRRRRR